MKKLLLLLAVAMTTAFTVQAQKIAFVDMNTILERIPEYKAAQKELDATAERWKQEISIEYGKIETMYRKYQAQEVLMSETTRQQREQEIVDKEGAVREMQKSKFGPEGDLFKKRQELVKPIQDRVYAVIQKFAGDRGFDFIFDKGSMPGMLFGAPGKDKTEEIIDKLKL